VVLGSFLNETNGQDEIHAVVTLIDTDTISAAFVSNRIDGNWP
jgi:hypothetical protein